MSALLDLSSFNVDEFIRPSATPALEQCEGRAAMEARAIALIPELATRTSPQARMGIVGHALAEQAISLIYDHGMPAPEAHRALADSYSDLDSWTRSCATKCVTYVVALVEREKKACRRVKVYHEIKMSGRGLEMPRGGTADILIASWAEDPRDRVPFRLIFEDHKLGFLDQGHAADHLQIAAYVVMGWDRMHKWARLDDYSACEVEAHVAQPRAWNYDTNSEPLRYTAATYTSEHIEPTRRKLIGIYRRARGARPKLNPCIKACRYCKALVLCRAAREHFMDAAESAALFGINNANLVEMNEAAKIARRFAEEVKEAGKILSERNNQPQTLNQEPTHVP